MTIAEQIEAEGINKGIIKGILKGIKEERIIIAKRLVSENIEDTFIAKITELSLEQIRKLKTEVSH